MVVIIPWFTMAEKDQLGSMNDLLRLVSIFSGHTGIALLSIQGTSVDQD